MPKNQNFDFFEIFFQSIMTFGANKLILKLIDHQKLKKMKEYEFLIKFWGAP